MSDYKSPSTISASDFRAWAWVRPLQTMQFWTEQAIQSIASRIQEMNPVDDLEEMACAQKTRDFLSRLMVEFQSLPSAVRKPDSSFPSNCK